MTIEVRKAKQDEFKEVAQFASFINSFDNLQCLHCSHSEDGFFNDLIEVLEEEPEPVIIAIENNKIIGSIVYDLNHEKTRTWLWGPFIEEKNWSKVGQLLLDKLFDSIPESVSILDIFSNLKNTFAIDLYLKNGFIKNDISHIYSISKNNKSNSLIDNNDFQELEQYYHKQFIDLHDKSFKNSYYSGIEIIKEINEHKKVFIDVLDNKVTGYIFFNDNNSEDQGYIDFLAVDPEYRCKGIGKKLLLQAINKIFKSNNVNKINLTVNNKKDNAKSLYEKAGFNLIYSGITARREL